MLTILGLMQHCILLSWNINNVLRDFWVSGWEAPRLLFFCRNPFCAKRPLTKLRHKCSTHLARVGHQKRKIGEETCSEYSWKLQNAHTYFNWNGIDCNLCLKNLRKSTKVLWWIFNRLKSLLVNLNRAEGWLKIYADRLLQEKPRHTKCFEILVCICIWILVVPLYLVSYAIVDSKIFVHVALFANRDCSLTNSNYN